jgi:hypothetical protein
MGTLKNAVAVVGLLLAFAGVAVLAAPKGDIQPVAHHGAVQVGIAATAVPAAPLGARNAFQIQNLGPVDIYCGWGATVTVATGTRISASGGTQSIDVTVTGAGVNTPALYCLVASGGAQVSPEDTRYLEVR